MDKNPWNAQARIIEENGRHFDPDVVDTYVANEEEFLAIRDRFAAEENLAPASPNILHEASV